jgi:CubicO group peptidase (beta-lactamase class C family)
VLLAVVVATLAARGASAQSAPDPVAIDRLLRAEADSGFSGVVLIAVGDSVLLHRGYGPAGARPDPASAFWIASMTKGFTAAAVLRLQEQGRLSVRDSIARFFPWAPADKRAITLQQLLVHTSGLVPGHAGEGVARRDAAVRAILDAPLARAPGSAFEYEDDDYELLAAVVEVASGMRWEEYVERELLRPNGLAATGFWCRPRRGVPIPIAATDGGHSRCRLTGDWGHRGANGMSSTAADLLRWSRFQAAGGALGPAGAARFTAADAPAVLVRREPPADVWYAFGSRVFVIDGRTAEVTNLGSGDDGHTSAVRIFPSGLTIVVLSNGGSRGGVPWAAYVAGLLGARGQ